MDLGLRNAATVVTGGTKGMGRAASEAFAREGARVAVPARRRSGRHRRDPDRTGEPGRARVSADLTDAAAVQAAFEVAAAVGRRAQRAGERGRSGRGGRRAFDELDDDEWMATFDIGTMSAVRCVRAALPLLRRGRVGADRERVRPLDEAAVARPDRLHRGEGGADELVEEPVAVAGARRDPREHGLARLVHVAGHAGLPGGPAGRSRASTPTTWTTSCAIITEDFGHPAHLGRAGDPAEIGPVIAFVASRVNTYMTGANVNVDGGSDFT